MLDPLENGLYDIPDYDHTEDEAFPPLPPPLSPGQEDVEADLFANGDDEDEVSKLAEVPVAKRRSVKRPQPKLDSQRLTSDRGLPALRTLFDNVRFKGKGHEAEDLKVLVQKMENWAHRLYPKLQFEDFIDKLETLGSKKEVQTCLKRIRLDMPLTHEDFIGNDGQVEAHVQDEPDLFGDGDFPDDPVIHSTPAPTSISLTEEQQRRMELNKQLALERKLARQQRNQDVSGPLCGDPEEPSASTSTCLLSEEEPENIDSIHPKTKTPQKQAASQHSPLYDKECDSPVPKLTNGIDDSD